jgi:hypothetical protein
LEGVVFDGGSGEEFVGCCDDMVKNGFVYLVPDE